MWEKIDKLYLGIIVGIVIPAVLYMIFFYTKVQHLSYFQGAAGNFTLQVLPLLLTRCIFPNALLFFLATWKNLLAFAKGILISTAGLTIILILITLYFKIT